MFLLQPRLGARSFYGSLKDKEIHEEKPDKLNGSSLWLFFRVALRSPRSSRWSLKPERKKSSLHLHAYRGVIGPLRGALILGTLKGTLILNPPTSDRSLLGFRV